MAKEKVPEKIRLDKDSFDIIYNAIRDVYEYNQAYRPANYLFQGDVLTYKEKANQWKGREQELKKNNGQGFKQLGDFDEALQWYVHTAVTCQYTDQDKLRELQDMAVSITQDGVYGFILTLFQKKYSGHPAGREQVMNFLTDRIWWMLQRWEPPNKLSTYIMKGLEYSMNDAVTQYHAQNNHRSVPQQEDCGLIQKALNHFESTLGIKDFTSDQVVAAMRLFYKDDKNKWLSYNTVADRMFTIYRTISHYEPYMQPDGSEDTGFDSDIAAYSDGNHDDGMESSAPSEKQDCEPSSVGDMSETVLSDYEDPIFEDLFEAVSKLPTGAYEIGMAYLLLLIGESSEQMVIDISELEQKAADNDFAIVRLMVNNIYKKQGREPMTREQFDVNRHYVVDIIADTIPSKWKPHIQPLIYRVTPEEDIDEDGLEGKPIF